MKFSAILAAATVFIAAGAQATETKTVTVGKLFPYLGSYYGLAPADRSQFHLAYRLQVDGAKADQIRLVMQDGSNAVPIGLDPTGHLSPLPTVAQLKANAPLIVTRPDDAKIRISLDAAPNLPMAQTMDARILALAVSQALAGSKTLAGLFAMAMPTLDRVDFQGVTSGEVTLANGTVKALPFTAATIDKDGHRQPAQVSFVPGAWPGAVSVRLDTTPSNALIDAKP